MLNFKEARKFLAQIPNIDCGGCGICALSLYRWDKKFGKVRYDEDFWILYEDYDEEVFSKNSKNLENGNLAGLIPPAHVMYQSRGILYDHGMEIYPEDIIDAINIPEGFFVGGYKFKYYHIFGERELVEYLNIPISSIPEETWHVKFDRITQIPIIEKTLGIYLGDIKKGAKNVTPKFSPERSERCKDYLGEFADVQPRPQFSKKG